MKLSWFKLGNKKMVKNNGRFKTEDNVGSRSSQKGFKQNQDNNLADIQRLENMYKGFGGRK